MKTKTFILCKMKEYLILVEEEKLDSFLSNFKEAKLYGS